MRPLPDPTSRYESAFRRLDELTRWLWQGFGRLLGAIWWGVADRREARKLRGIEERLRARRDD